MDKENTSQRWTEYCQELYRYTDEVNKELINEFFAISWSLSIILVLLMKSIYYFAQSVAYSKCLVYQTDLYEVINDLHLFLLNDD